MLVMYAAWIKKKNPDNNACLQELGIKVQSILIHSDSFDSFWFILINAVSRTWPLVLKLAVARW